VNVLTFPHPTDGKSVIPAEKQDVVARALQATFGSTPLDQIELLSGGFTSAIVCRIVVAGASYVLRVIQHVDAFNDPIRQYACMNTAAAAGIAPRVYYADATDALSITAYIAPKELSSGFPDYETLLRELAGMIRTIHSTPLFPVLIPFMEGMDLFVQGFQASALLPLELVQEHFSFYNEIRSVYPRDDTDLVSSHNDLNRNNLLFDGKKIWVIDWEAAFRNDRYTDLANIGNFFARDEREEDIFLGAYFGESLDDYKRSRYFLMRQTCHFFYALAILQVVAGQKPAGESVETSMETPRLREFLAGFAVTGSPLGRWEGKLLFAKVLLNEALYQMKTPRFAASITRVRRGE
jgi:aminoglycoside phosphotransferase (APT) family kinase protein